MTETAPEEGESRTSRLLWPLAVCVVTGLSALIPMLESRTFYMRGDTGAQFAPTWYHLGELVRGGTWPPLVDPDSWAGGNFVGEGLFGVYSPVNLLVWVGVSLAPDLLLAVSSVKALVLIVLALGTYLLCREYGARPWAAAVLATALPISGFTLYWDAGSWASGLMAFTYAPWVWWSFRRALRGTASPLWAFLIGVLAVLQGNPYGTLGVVVVGVGLLAEGWATSNGRGAVRLLVLGACVAAFLPLVYLPLIEAVELAYRSNGPLFDNNGKLQPELGDLAMLSAPTFVPDVRAITGGMRVPATYLAWFVVPLLPWLRYRLLRPRLRELTGVAVVSAIYLVMTLGPSKLWLFRWPLRLVEYLYLGVAVLLAVLLSQGLHRDRWRARLLGTGALVGVMAWVTWARDPRWESAALGGTAMVVVLTAVVLAWHRWGNGATVVTAALLAGGSSAVLLGQMTVFGENASSRPWYFPSDVSTLEQRFADRDGLVLQFADLKPLQKPGPARELRRSWQHYLAGSMYQVAGVDAINNYTGMGLEKFTDRLCMGYDGLTRACGYRRVWEPVTPSGPPLVDLLKVDTLVVQPQLASGVQPGTGWQTESVPDGPLVLTRTAPLPWPESRLTTVPDEAEVADARSTGTVGERVELATTGAGGRLVFATLAWPGYRATLDGEPVELVDHPVGLLTVELPPDRSGVLEIGYRPPGLLPGLAAAAVGTVGALALALAGPLGRRARRSRTR